MNNYLPTSVKEMKKLGWDRPDVILFTGDAYVDHPAFGTAIIARILEQKGLKVAIVPQPNWQDDLRDFKKFGNPKLFFGVSAGNMDSMVNHYTANIRKRSNDAYTPGGMAGARPDYASVVYTQILKEQFPDTPVILGGVEASLRRFTHFDYWSDKLKTSILFENKADLLVYGMGEKALQMIVERLLDNKGFDTLTDIPQTAYLTSINEGKSFKCEGDIELFPHGDCIKSKQKFASNFVTIEQESVKMGSSRIFQTIYDRMLIVNPPFPPLSGKEMDTIYDLPFTRLPHPRYNNKAPIPAYEMIRHSVNMHRGCFGSCSFCTISAHQGKFISSRSLESIVKEVEQIKNMPDFKGHVTDLGGPSANMYDMEGKDMQVCKLCNRISCIYPKVCKNLNTNHSNLLKVYRQVRKMKGIKHVTIGSGIRYDLLLTDTYKNGKMVLEQDKSAYLKELLTYHVSGRLKVAPEHTSDKVLSLMRKPDFQKFNIFKQLFDAEKISIQPKLQLIPYFISSHPGCTIKDMAELALQAKNHKLFTDQVQDFTPTPMTLSSVMFYTGIDPYTGKQIYIARNQQQKKNQRAFFFYHKPENKAMIKRLLQQSNIHQFIDKLYKNKRY